MDWKVVEESQLFVQVSGPNVFLQESQWFVQEYGQEFFTGKSLGCTGKWNKKFYRKVSGLYRKVDGKVIQESQENEIKSSTGKSGGCTGNWTGKSDGWTVKNTEKFYRKISGV